MWLLHFIFEGLFVYFFKTAGKDVTLKWNEMTVCKRERQREIIKNFLEETRRKGKGESL